MYMRDSQFRLILEKNNQVQVVQVGLIREYMLDAYKIARSHLTKFKLIG
jgi:hypothetical protein